MTHRPPTPKPILTVAVASAVVFGGCAVVAPAAGADPDTGGALVPLLGEAEVAADVDGFEGAFGVAAAEDGTVYVADIGAGQVVAVDDSGRAEVVAGSGRLMIDGGDDGPATDAYLESPGAVAVGPDGTLYIGDGGDLTVRAVDPEGSIRTVHSADTDPAGASHLSLAASDDGVYVGIPDGGIVHVDADDAADDDAEQVVEPEEFGEDDPRGLDVAADGTLHVAAGSEVYTVEDDGSLAPALSSGAESLASGEARDVAVDDGVLYVAGEKGLLVDDGSEVRLHLPLDLRQVELHDGFLYLVDASRSGGGDGDGPTSTVWRTPAPEETAPVRSFPPAPDVEEPDAADQESYDPGTMLPGPVEVRGSEGRPTTLAAGHDGSLTVATDGRFLSEGEEGRDALPDSRVRDMAVAGDGSIIYLTGGGLHQLFPDGSVTILTRDREGIRSLAVGDGVVYAATSDVIFTVEDDLELVPFVDLAADYEERRTVADLAVDSDGTLVVLDGERDDLLHLSEDGDRLSEWSLDVPDEGRFTGTALAVPPGDGRQIYVSGQVRPSDGTGVGAQARGVILRFTDRSGRIETIAAESPDPDVDTLPAPARTMYLDDPHSLSVDTAGNLHFIDDGETYMLHDPAAAPTDSKSWRNTMLRMALVTVLAVGIAAGVLRYVALQKRGAAAPAQGEKG